ncbi:fatty acid desaturase family protein [Staphylococcus hominis]|uniref:fatty acid desaturase family protein n=1 Tax=Staphylococcus hominis TaxID=1290 RepID=UPI0018ED4FB3|nr:fatty acid desaturase family protein [Staphylococcus hominis]MBJ6365082.1 fatty acid desaturase family protein [Staphylococcus hominis]
MSLKLEKAVFSKEIKKELKPLMKKDNYHNIFALLFDWLVIFGSAYLSITTGNIFVYLLSIILIGSRMRADEENDPDTKRYRIVGLDKPQENINKFIKDHIIKVLLLFHVPKYILGTVSANLYSKDIPKSELWTRNILWLVLISTSIVFNFWFYLIIFWFVPLLTTFQIIRYWAEMAEHSGLNNDTELTASRNTFGMPWTIFLFHPHHDNYHLVHHLFPAIPHYNLKKAHSILMQDKKYREAHHCTGFFKTTLPGFYSVVKDICTPNSKMKES